MIKVWCLAWAYIYEILGQIDRLGDWMADQIDHNDYLVGALVVVYFIVFSWFLGAVQIGLGWR